MTLPRIVSAQEWQRERDALLVEEKALTRAADRVNAQRRRLPMVEFRTDYVLAGPDGPAGLLDLFAGRRQLIVYHFMLHAGDPHRCPGCSLLVDNIGPLEHLHARDVSLAVVAPARTDEIEPFRARMGWTVPFYSSYGSDFTPDCGVGGYFGVSVFLREGDRVFRTWFTTGRGGDQFVGTLRYLDVTPFGRQEAWEPESRGTDGPSAWWRLHDEYDA